MINNPSYHRCNFLIVSLKVSMTIFLSFHFLLVRDGNEMYRFDGKVYIELYMHLRQHSQVKLNRIPSCAPLGCTWKAAAWSHSLSLHTATFLLRKYMKKLNLFRAGRRTPALRPFSLYFYNITAQFML